MRDKTFSAETADSDDESAGYWLRIPAGWAESRTTAVFERRSTQTPKRSVRIHCEPAQRTLAEGTQHRGGCSPELVVEHGERQKRTETQTSRDTESVQQAARTQTMGQGDEGLSPGEGEMQLEDEQDIPHQTEPDDNG